jgi:broad specificity phosphatase PhoE
MTNFLLIRHGQADYECLTSRHFPIVTSPLAPLTDKGIAQAVSVAKDERLQGAQLILSSPYTRALQSASIISNETKIQVKVEFDLHEWIPDLNFKIDEAEFNAALRSFIKNSGKHNGQYTWEQISDVKERALLSLSHYSEYDKIIVVTHSEVIYSLTNLNNIVNCGIVELKL